MTPRKRLSKNKDLPPFLYHNKSKGYVLTLVNGIRKVVSQKRAEAIIIANEYNKIKRAGTILEDLLNGSASNAPLCECIDSIIQRMIEDKAPGSNLVTTWMNDSGRMKEFFTMPGSDIDLGDVTEYLDKYHPGASNNVYNRKLSFLELVFNYAKDIGEMTDNPAALKIKKPKESKKRRALDIAAFVKIRTAAPLWLRTAMDLTMQTTHAVLEVSRIEYRIKKPEPNRCGCIWYEEPKIVDGNHIYGELAIHRQKTHKSEASHVMLPIGQAIKDIIDKSRDSIASPYVVHRFPKGNSNPMSQHVKHITQIVSRNISNKFSDVRDQLGLYSELPKEERPTYHEIRGLSARLIEAQGIDPQYRMGHSSSKSTKVYTCFGKDIEWTQVPHVQISI
ncbi:tyrosine-type recombinase/integrase [Pseudoalteromonas piscicida]|uniref:tyrosine-type recombinase/integrase n=1 Tax=Pseudoalteromonas piscicida TaxID=43662 RepID=UPI0005FA1FE5|nr:tyrosine-type recombinase/integrase [Pseudoalteromonas piscicida]KJZ03254.1 hypothetical protein TW73_08870 [Pseudoalteromonas piscicida]